MPCVSDIKPSENLKTLVTYIIRVYAPTWFAIKAHSSCKDRAGHLHQMLVSLNTSALSTRRSLTQSFTATRTSLTEESALGHDDGLSTTHTRAGPSCTSQCTNTEVQGTEVTPIVIFPKFPCHTQAVERHVKLVTEAATAVCGQNSRDGFIRVRVVYQQLMPTFKSKRDFSHFTM